MANLTPRPDDRTYDQLVDLLRRQLPTEEHTDHNASDPGIMLNELLSWLAEMTLYRMNRVPESHQAKFLDFLIDPPEPVTVDVRFQATFQVAPASGSVTIPAGTLLATDFDLGRRTVFETIQTLTLTRPLSLFAEGTVTARAILEVTGEALGVSDGHAEQVYLLRPPRHALGITDPDAAAPILIDYVHRTAAYEPNPRVRVGAEVWTAMPSLGTDASRVTALNPAKHFMVEPNESRVRFGDGRFGAIPPLGAVITCDRYAVLDGPPPSEAERAARKHALKVRAGDVKHMLNFAPPADVTLSLVNKDAEGGAHFFPVSRRFELGLREFRAPFRLVTEADFERAVMEDFNAFQELSAAALLILRASVVFNRRPPLDDDTEAPGYVTLVLVADAPSLEDTLRDETIAVATKQGLVNLPAGLWQRLKRFLDPRRLITTRLELHTPLLKAFTMNVTVVASRDRNVARLQEELRGAVQDFLSIVRGGFDGRGWKLGRSVYRSQLFRLLEGTDGVDHVAGLSLSPADAQGNVPIAPHELPLLQSLALTVVRG